MHEIHITEYFEMSVGDKIEIILGGKNFDITNYLPPEEKAKLKDGYEHGFELMLRGNFKAGEKGPSYTPFSWDPPSPPDPPEVDDFDIHIKLGDKWVDLYPYLSEKEYDYYYELMIEKCEDSIENEVQTYKENARDDRP